MYQHIPVSDFDSLNTTTMTVTIPLKTTNQNLPNIYLMVPTTKYTEAPGYKKLYKGGKLAHPKAWVHPKTGQICKLPIDEIITSRYNKDSKGIERTTSDAFPTSITFDINTSLRPICIKFSQTIKITGPPSFEIAQEAVANLLNKIRNVQEYAKYLETHRKEAYDSINRQDEDDLLYQVLVYMNIYNINNLDNFYKYIEINGTDLYEGELEPEEYHSEMINRSFELGFIVHLNNMYNIFQNTIFVCDYNNIRNNSTAKIVYNTTKKDRKGKLIPGRHIFKINKSGNVTFSGPNLKDMIAVYYSFYKIILSNMDKLTSNEQYIKTLKLNGKCRVIKLSSWIKYLKEEQELKNRILNEDVPLCVNNNIIYRYVNTVYYDNNTFQ